MNNRDAVEKTLKAHGGIVLLSLQDNARTNILFQIVAEECDNNSFIVVEILNKTITYMRYYNYWVNWKTLDTETQIKAESIKTQYVGRYEEDGIYILKKA